MNRRGFLRTTAAGTAAALSPVAALGAPVLAQEPASGQKTAQDYLRSLVPTRKQVDDFVGQRDPAGWYFDPLLGWLVRDGVRNDGVDGSKTFLHFDSDGARRVVNGAQAACRLHTYGDSFTCGDQVSDGETWQEQLAAHLQEPIRNYGIGGYGVYQAYLRMVQVQKTYPVDYVVLNIYDNDHYRNLHSFRAIDTGNSGRGDYTLPHLRVNVGKRSCEKRENLFKKPDDVYKLCDPDAVWEMFKDDPTLRVRVALRGDAEPTWDTVEAVAQSFGVRARTGAGVSPKAAVQSAYTEAALFATRNVVMWAERFAQENRKKLLFILSFNSSNMGRGLRGEPGFDETFATWIKKRTYPVIDTRDVFRKDYESRTVAGQKADVQQYLRAHYIGHHTPLGHFAMAKGIKDQIVNWLDPRPLPYRT
jgi:hypothetical protein